MNQLQMLKRALIAYVNSVKAVWSKLAYPLSIKSKRKGTLKDYLIYGNTVQNGEPTPANPIEMQSVGELTKNLWSGENYIISDSNTRSCVAYLYPNENPWIVSGTTVTVSATVCVKDARTNTRMNVQTRLADTTVPDMNVTWFNSYGDEVRVSVTYTIPHYDVEIRRLEIRFIDYSSSPSGVWDAYVKDIQIEYGDTATEFEPFQKYKVPVIARGKNLFDVASYPLTKGRIIWGNSGGLSDEGQVNYASTLDYIPCAELKGKVITVNHTLGSGAGIAFYDANKTFISGVRYENAKSKTVTVPDSASYYRFSVAVIYVDEIQVEYGTEATEFEPYKEPQSYHIYLDEPLRKIGDYADSIDFEKGVVKRNVGKRAFDGTEDWKYEALSMGNNFYVKVADAVYLGETINVLCNMGAFIWGGSLTLSYSCKISSALNFNFRYQEFSDLQSFKDKLKEFSDEGNPLCINYALKSSTEEEITLPKLPQFKGTTVYEVGTTIKPSGMEVCYYK